MQENNYFPQNINTGKSGINSKEKSQPILLFYPTISKNSYILNDNELSENRVILDGNNNTEMKINELKQNDNYIRNIKLFKTSNNYYKKRDYKKFLNAPQSVNCSTMVSNSGIGRNNNNFRISEPNRNLYKYFNSNIDEEKNLYNKLSTEDLIEITQRRKKIIEEKKLKEEMKKQMMLQEEEQLKNNIIINNNFENFDNSLKFCEEGVQTTLKFKKNNNESKNLKESKNTEIDFVNIGNETIDNINNEINLSTLKNSNDMQFNIINNNTLLSNTNKNSETEKFNVEINTDNELMKSIEEEKKFNNKNILSNNESYNNDNNINNNNITSSIKDDNEMTQVEEFDQKNIIFQNESKTIFSEYEKSLEKTNKNKNDVKMETSLLSDYPIEINNDYSKENISSKNRYDYNLSNDKENVINNSKVENNLFKESNVNSKQINVNLYKEFNSFSNTNSNKNLNINNSKNDNFGIFLQNKIKYSSLNPNNRSNRRYSSDIIFPEKDIIIQSDNKKSTSLTKIIFNSNIDINKKKDKKIMTLNIEKNIKSVKDINTDRNIKAEKNNTSGKQNKLIQKKIKKKRQLNNYAEYYKLKMSSNKDENTYNNLNINGIINDKNSIAHIQNSNCKNFNFSINYNSPSNIHNINHEFGSKGKKFLKTDKNFYMSNRQNNFEGK